MQLVDTSIIIDLFHGHPATITLIKKLSRLSMSVITVAELELGFIRFSKGTTERGNALQTLMQNREIEVLPVTDAVASHYAKIQAHLLERGKQLGQFDGLIAATALAYGLELVTYDADFQRVPGLHVYPIEAA